MKQQVSLNRKYLAVVGDQYMVLMIHVHITGMFGWSTLSVHINMYQGAWPRLMFELSFLISDNLLIITLWAL